MRLSYEGLRAQDRALDLGRLNLLSGPCGSGKSSALDAVAIVALDYAPRVGRDKESTARLMRGNALRATLERDGLIFQGGLRLDGGKLTSIGVTYDSARPDANQTDARKAITARFGRTAEEAAQNVDGRVLLRCSGAERRAAIDRLLAPGKPSAEAAVRLLIARLAFGKEADAKEALIPDDAASAFRLAGDRAAVAQTVAQDLPRYLDQGIGAALKWAAEGSTQARADVKRKTAARGEFEDRNLGVQTAGETQAALGAQRDEAVAKRGGAAARLNGHLALTDARARAEADLATAKSAAAGAEESLARKRAAAAAIDGLRTALAAIVDPTDPAAPTPVPAPSCPEADAKDAEAATLRGEYEVIRDSEPPPRVEPAPEIRARAEALKAEATSIVVPEVPSVYAAELAVTTAEREVKLAEENPWREVEAHFNDLSQYGFVDRNGHLLTMCAPFVALRDLAVRHGGNVVALRAALARAKEALGQATLLRDGAQVEAENATTKRDQLLAEAEQLWRAECVRVMAANDEAQRRYGEAVKAVELRRRNLRARIDALAHEAGHIRRATQQQVDDQNRAAADQHRRAVEANALKRGLNAGERRKIEAEIAGLESAVRVAERIAAEARSSVAAAEARLAGLAAAAPLDVDAARKEIADLDAAVQSLDQRIAALKQAEARRAEMRALLAEIDAADAAKDVFAAAEWALRRTAERDLARRTGPLLDRVRTFLVGAGIEHEPYLEIGTDSTDLGWIVDGSRRSIDGALSGGETTLLLTALTAAVVSLRAPEIRILCTEIAEAHSGYEARLLQGCAAVAPWFDAVLVAAPETARAFATPDWNVIEFRNEEVAHAA